MLRCRKRTTERNASHIRQRRYSVASLDVEIFKNEPKRPQILRSKSLGAGICSDTFGQRLSKEIKERPTSAPSRVGSDGIFTQQHNQLIVSVQVENAPAPRKTELQKNTTELERSLRHIGRKIRDRSKIRGGWEGWCKHGEGHGFSCKHKREGQTFWCMSLRGGGALFFVQRCWGQGVNLQFLCSHSHSSVNIIWNTFVI